MINQPTYKSIDLCSCYESTDEMSVEQQTELDHEKYEPTLENTSFYVVEPDGTEYFYCGNSRVKVSEHFPENGKTIRKLMKNVIQYAARSAPR